MISPFFLWAWRQRQLLPSQRIILMEMASSAAADGTVSCRLIDMAHRLNIADTTVHSALKHLVRIGIVEPIRAGKGRHLHVYRLKASA